jgi:glucose-6-phosphate isomerase
MLKNTNPTKTVAWEKLQKHFEEAKEFQMKELFSEDPKRFENSPCSLTIFYWIFLKIS